MNNEPPADPLEFWVRFICGALFGGIGGLLTIGQGDSSEVPGEWVWLGVGAVICGLLAAWFGDRFWHWFNPRGD